MSLLEISGAIGSCSGPFIGSALNYLFGYAGPFIVFCNHESKYLLIEFLYLLMFPLIKIFIPVEEVDKNIIINDCEAKYNEYEVISRYTQR